MDSSRHESLPHVSRRAYLRLGAALVLGLVARLSLAVKTPFEYQDGATFGSWARTLRDHPLAEFYASARRPDHLPGDLWLLKLLQAAYTAAGGSDFSAPAFTFLLKTVPITADLVIGVLVFNLVRLWTSEESAVRAAQWYLLNPAVIVLSAVWGQWDALSAAVVLAGLLLVARGGPATVWAAPFLVWAVLIKPTLVIVDAMILVWLLASIRRRPGRLGRGPYLRTSLVLGGLGAATAVAILAPFRIGLAWAPSGGSSLLERARYAADLYPVTTMGASNLWLIIDRSVIGRADDVPRWGSLTPATVAAILFALVVGAVCLQGWRAFRSTGHRPEAMLWSGAAAMFGSCLVLTRVHERYYFPVLLLLLLWAAARQLDVVASGFYWAFSVLFMIDLALPLHWTQHRHGFSHQPTVLAALGAIHVIFFAALLVTPWRRRPEASLETHSRHLEPLEVRAGEPSGASAVRQTARG